MIMNLSLITLKSETENRMQDGRRSENNSRKE